MGVDGAGNILDCPPGGDRQGAFGNQVRGMGADQVDPQHFSKFVLRGKTLAKKHGIELE